MKYFVLSVLSIPLYSACAMVQEDSFNQQYYRPATPQVQIESSTQYPRSNNYHGHHNGRPQANLNQRTYHGHGQEPNEEMVINPQLPNVHGHRGSQPKISRHPQVSAETHGNVHGNDSTGIKNKHSSEIEELEQEHKHP